jgi:hypothetical protein
MKKITILFLALFFSVQVNSQTINGEIVSDTGDVRIIKLWGTHAERGFALGYLNGERGLDILENMLLPYYGDNWQIMRGLIEDGTFKYDSLHVEEAKSYIAGLDSAGLNGAGYDYLDMLAASLYNDMNSWPFPGSKLSNLCSTFMSWNDATAGTDLDGKSVISRHLDTWPVDSSLYRTATVIVHIPSEEGLQPWLIMSFGSTMGPTSGVNQSGFCIFQNGLNGNWSPDTNSSYVPVRCLARKALESEDYNLDGVYNMKDIEDALIEHDHEVAGGRVFSMLGPSTEIHDSLIALVAEIGPNSPYLTFRSTSYNDSIEGDNLFAANSQIARNNARDYCIRYTKMIDSIQSGTGFGSERHWRIMGERANLGNMNIMYMQYIPEWSQLKLSVCRIIDGVKYPAYQLEPVVMDLEELFRSPVGIDQIQDARLKTQVRVFPNPASETAIIRCRMPDAGYRMIELFSIEGKKIQNILKESSAGYHEIEIDVSDLPDGVYFIRVQAGREVAVVKLLVVH